MRHGRGASESCRAGSPSPGDHALTVIGYIETVAEVLRSTLSRFVCMMICCVKPSSVSTQVICLSSGEPARLKSLSRHLLPVSEPRKIKSSLISSLSLHTRHPTRTNTPTFLLSSSSSSSCCLCFLLPRQGGHPRSAQRPFISAYISASSSLPPSARRGMRRRTLERK